MLYELVSPTFSVVALMATTIYILVSAVEVLRSADNNGPNIIVMWSFMLLNLAIDIVNMFLFVRERHELHRSGVATHESNANMLSALTHVVIDTMRTVAVLIALFVHKLCGLAPSLADAYASIAIAVLSFLSTVPLWRVLWGKLILLDELKRTTTGTHVPYSELPDT